MSYLLIGLGNPGKKFESTRHNAGKMLAAHLSNYPIAGLEVFETDCFMDVSGNFVRKIVQNTQKIQRTRDSEIQTIRKSDIRFSGIQTLRLSDHQSIPSFPNLFISHDDLDLRLGSYKIQFGKGPRLHKGILSVEQALGTKNFWRIRIGIENRKNKMATMAKNGYKGFNHSSPSDHYNHLSASGSDYVLEKFTAAEKKTLEGVFPEIRDRLKTCLRLPRDVPDGTSLAMTG